MLKFQIMDSPVGKLQLIAHDHALVAVLWECEKENRVRVGVATEDLYHPILLKTRQQLSEYFVGQRQSFDLPLEFQGTTFQRQVWQALLSIPYGETRSYQDIAIQLGNINAVRAVGMAAGKNAISIIAPCHRVIGKNGRLVGFAGGLRQKKILLEIEQNTHLASI